ncbi:MAG TPA: hypothetical protein VFT68_01840 [Lapillicoccus sp.]|nr:hypothetical protein [Lapillicoccus sp.]
MTTQPGASPVGYEGLRDLPFSALLDEFDRVERLLAQRAAPSHDAGRPDFSAEALRGRERAVVAEIRRRPGGARPRPGRAPLSAGAPPG